MGMAKWTHHHATQDDHAQWTGWRAGIGMAGRNFPALDIDVDDPDLANAINEMAMSTLGDAPVRFGRGSRRILVYAGSGLTKRRVAFERVSEASGDADQSDLSTIEAHRPALQAVEFLATGQQYVIEGIHPKTGQPYVWLNGRSPAVIGAGGLRTVTADQLDAFCRHLEDLLELHGYDIKKRDKEGRSGVVGAGGVWQDGLLAPSIEAVERALAALPNEADYDEWINVMIAVKASTGGSGEGFDLFADWSATSGLDVAQTTVMKYESFRPPYSMGWDWLARFCTERGGGKFSSVAEDFDAVEEAPLLTAEGKPVKEGPILPSAVQAMFDRYVWVEQQKRVCDLKSGEMLDREQFNVRNSHIGHPADSKGCAWAVLTSQLRHLQAVKTVTYRPGGSEFVYENLPGLQGRCINVWKPTPTELPVAATDSQVKPWLDHLAFILPDDRERNIVLDWLAWIIQHPGEKPNWCLVIGSTFEGMGKDLMLEPVRTALGAGNVREITAEDLAANETDYLDRTRLLLVEEMQMYERKAMENKLKPIIAAPPYTLRVNIKFVPRYEIPNLIAAIFFTNMENALAISRQGRRYFVTWNDGQPKDDAYYEGLVAWYAAGGGALAARWLIDRDVSAFKAKGKAPATTAREDMRKAALPEAEGLIEEGLQHREAPFHRRFIALPEVRYHLANDREKARCPDAKAVARKLKGAGAISLGRVNLGRVPRGVQAPNWDFDERQTHLFAHLGDMEAEGLITQTPAIRAAFWADWGKDGKAVQTEGADNV